MSSAQKQKPVVPLEACTRTSSSFGTASMPKG